MIRLHKRLRTLRKAHHLTQEELAGKIKMSQPGYSKYETGTNNIPADKLIKLARLYETSVDYLLDLTDCSQPYNSEEETEEKRN